MLLIFYVKCIKIKSDLYEKTELLKINTMSIDLMYICNCIFKCESTPKGLFYFEEFKVDPESSGSTLNSYIKLDFSE